MEESLQLLLPCGSLAASSIGLDSVLLLQSATKLRLFQRRISHFSGIFSIPKLTFRSFITGKFYVFTENQMKAIVSSFNVVTLNDGTIEESP